MSREEVIRRIDDWETRLGDLCAQLDEWCDGLGPSVTRREGFIHQRVEDLMKRYGIEPRQLPTRAFFHENIRCAFVPSSIWVVAAMGRVNVTTNFQQHKLVDIRKEVRAPSEWHIASPDLNVDIQPFTREVFGNLVMTGRPVTDGVSARNPRGV